jgi:hypothetical protein
MAYRVEIARNAEAGFEELYLSREHRLCLVN